MQLKFTDAELKEIKESVWESLDQYSYGTPALDLTAKDVAPMFNEDELARRQSILRKLNAIK